MLSYQLGFSCLMTESSSPVGLKMLLRGEDGGLFIWRYNVNSVTILILSFGCSLLHYQLSTLSDTCMKSLDEPKNVR